MDPQAAWDQLLEAYTEGDWSAVDEFATDLLEWTGRGGFPPRTSPNHKLGDEWNSAVAQFACQFALDQSRMGGQQ